MKYSKKDENYVYYYVGKNLAKYRKEKGMTQQDLADKYADDRKKYTAFKADFIREVISLAKDEFVVK